MRVLVTGATGNVGTAVLRALQEEPAVTEVVGLARRLPGEDARGRVARWVAADVRDAAALADACAGADAVVHLAWAIQPARDRDLTRAINVDGSRTVFRAAADAGVRTLVHASSVGAYAPAPDDAPRTEEHPATGIPSSFYSVDKAAAERLLDDLGRQRRMRIVRLRPGLIFQRAAAQEIRRLFAGPLLPSPLLRPGLVPAVPQVAGVRFQRAAAQEIRRLFAGPLLPSPLLRPGLVPAVPQVAGVRFQAVHAADVADAFCAALVRRDAAGAYNVAADDVLDLRTVAAVLRARALPPLPFGIVRRAADLAWRARLTPTPAGWLDIAAQVPVMDTGRARRELGWTPSHSGRAALAELLDGLRRRDGGDTPPLAADAGGPLRLREVASGLGARPGLTRRA